MKSVPLILCASMAIWSAPSLAQTKQSSLMQPGATILTLNKMCQEKPNSLQYTVCVAYLRGLFDGMQQAKMVVTDNPKDNKVSVGWAAPMALSHRISV
jgi:hypothetical protein